jgi:hypothetical protein
MGRGKDSVREEHDMYATNPDAVDSLLRREAFAERIWEPACGMGHISERLGLYGYGVRSTGLYDHGYGEPGIDFLAAGMPDLGADIVTNPPYSIWRKFARHAMGLLRDGGKSAMLLKLLSLETLASLKLFAEYPPKRVHVFSRRIDCARRGEFTGKTAVAYAWYVWEKGFSGAPEIHWIDD